MIDKFKDKFVEEALDNVHDLEESLLLLENDRSNKEIIERIFRAMHSLKGGGAMFGFNDLSDFTHHLETVFDWVRNGKMKVSDAIISLTLESIDHIRQLLDIGDLKNSKDIQTQKEFISKVQNILQEETGEKGPAQSAAQSTQQAEKVQVNEDGSKTYLITFEPYKEILRNGTNPFFLIEDLHALGDAIAIPFFKDLPVFSALGIISCYCTWQIVLNTTSPVNEIKDVFIFVEDECKLDIVEVTIGNITQQDEIKELVNQCIVSGEYLKIDQLRLIQQEVEEVSEEDQSLAKKNTTRDQKISSMRVSSIKVDELVNLVSELVTIQAQLNLYAENNGDPVIVALAENMHKLSRQLRDNAFEISLIPLQSELMRFQRLVRDLSKELGKEIDFVIEGGDIELDKNIIENLIDPLLHIIRNSLDHGIEMPAERVKAGKSPKGTIVFKAYYSGASVIIKVIDDGKGIDPDFIRKKAIQKGLIEPNVELSKKEIFDLLFMSGFSTRDQVSDVSGRGVGMDVVKRKIGEIRGEVIVDSEIGKGTTTTLDLPMTLSIIDGLLIKVGDNEYVIPISAVEKIYEFVNGKVGSTINHVITIENKQYAFIDLREVFEANCKFEGTEQLILVKSEDRVVGLVADQVIGEYQTVVKPLGRYLKSHGTISGASIMGNGNIAFVIDSNRLIHFQSSRKWQKK